MRIQLLELYAFNTGEVESGVAVTSYGQGQISGVTYVVPPFSEIEVDFTLRMQCITPENTRSLDNLIQSLLSASKQEEYERLKQTDVSGGLGFFGMWGASASYSDTERIFESWGLSEENQARIVSEMVSIANTFNELNYRGKINNQSSYSVSGNMFGIVMDATIKQGTQENQIRAIAPNAHLNSSDGLSSLPSVGTLYD